MLCRLSSPEPQGFKESPGGMFNPLHFIKGLISQKPFRSPRLNHVYILVPYAKTHPVTPVVSQGSWVRYPIWQHTFVSPSAFSLRAVVGYWRKYVHEVLVNRLRGLSLPRKSVVRLIDHPDMTLDVYRGHKTTTTTTPAGDSLGSCPTPFI